MSSSTLHHQPATTQWVHARGKWLPKIAIEQQKHEASESRVVGSQLRESLKCQMFRVKFGAHTLSQGQVDLLSSLVARKHAIRQKGLKRERRRIQAQHFSVLSRIDDALFHPAPLIASNALPSRSSKIIPPLNPLQNSPFNTASKQRKRKKKKKLNYRKRTYSHEQWQAANKIQSLCRMYFAKVIVWGPGGTGPVKHGAATVIQSLVRMRLGYRLAVVQRVRVKKTRAVVALQVTLRMHLLRKEREERRKAMIIERMRQLHEQRVEKLRNNIASKRIVRLTRAWLEVRKREHQNLIGMRAEEEFQREMERQRVEALRLAREAIEAERERLRAEQARRLDEAKRIKLEAQRLKMRPYVLTQAMIRRKLANSLVKRMHQSATKIQAIVRGRQGYLRREELEEELRMGGKYATVVYQGGMKIKNLYLQLQVFRSGNNYLISGFDPASCETVKGLFKTETIMQLVSKYPFGIPGHSTEAQNIKLSMVQFERITHILLASITIRETIKNVTDDLGSREASKAIVLRSEVLNLPDEQQMLSIYPDPSKSALNRVSDVAGAAAAISDPTVKCASRVFVDPCGGFPIDYSMLGRF